MVVPMYHMWQICLDLWDDAKQMPNFDCKVSQSNLKVSQSNLISMKLKLDVSSHLPNVCTSFKLISQYM